MDCEEDVEAFEQTTGRLMNKRMWQMEYNLKKYEIIHFGQILKRLNSEWLKDAV